jgi:cyanophycinase-like exopeptidase
MAGKFGSSDFGTKPFLADALRLTGKEHPVVLYVGAASADNREFGKALAGVMQEAGAHKVLWPKLGRSRPQGVRARTALDDADLVFIGGGDVQVGMRALADADLVDDLRTAARRGVVFAGMSAGAIMLGERWIRWPDKHATDDEAQTYECLGIAPCSLDTHGEADDWRETRSFAAVRARELGKEVRAFAVPSGAALVVSPDGSIRARGENVTVFAALPHKKAKIAETLEALE